MLQKTLSKKTRKFGESSPEKAGESRRKYPELTAKATPRTGESETGESPEKAGESWRMLTEKVWRKCFAPRLTPNRSAPLSPKQAPEKASGESSERMFCATPRAGESRGKEFGESLRRNNWRKPLSFEKVFGNIHMYVFRSPQCKGIRN